MASPYEKPPPYSPYPVQQPGCPPVQVQPSHCHQSQPNYGHHHGHHGAPGWAAPHHQAMPNYPNYGSTVVVQPPAQVIIVGGCPVCRVGVLEDDYTCLGIFLGIALFPLGLLCCLALRQRRCPNCNSIFD